MQYIIDEQGHRTGVLLTMEEWEQKSHLASERNEPIMYAGKSSSISELKSLIGTISPLDAQYWIESIADNRAGDR